MALWHIPMVREQDPLESLFDDIFDWTFPPTRFLTSHPYHDPRMRSLRHRINQQQQKKVGKDGDTFRVSLDVRHYDPDEITLKVDNDKLLVSGKHRKQSDYGYESSEFQRAYPIPLDVNAKEFTSKISDDGILEIEAPKKSLEATKDDEGGIHQDESKFKAILDVNDYKPDEMSVKVQGNELLIQGDQKSESKGDKETFVHHKQFVRRIVLPKTVKLESLQSKLTKDGKLVIEAEKMPEIEHEVKQLKIEKEEGDQAIMDE